MNLVSFVDELVKVGAMDPLLKRAAEDESSSSMNTNTAPAGMVGEGAVPRALRLVPGRATTRLGDDSGVVSQIVAGAQGAVTGSRDPIDRNKYNRWYAAAR